METPLGPESHNDSAANSTHRRRVPNTSGAFRYEVRPPSPLCKVPHIRLFRVLFDKETGEETGLENVADLPAISAQFDPGDGLAYVFPKPWAPTKTITVPALEMTKGEHWPKLSVGLPPNARAAAALAAVAVAESLPVIGTSPTVLEGLPPLAPSGVGPMPGIDPEQARQGWAWIAPRLGPLGRLTIGLMLASAWVEEGGAGENIMLGVYGDHGQGKSVLASVCAALYGDPKRDRGGLLRRFNFSTQALTAWSQRLAYLPCLLDEARSTREFPVMMEHLIGGSNRARASKSGGLVESDARWAGAALVTSNPRLSEEGEHNRNPLTDELWVRRLIEIRAHEGAGIWTEQTPANPWGRPPADDRDARAAWWYAIRSSLRTLGGAPWAAIQQTYTPGTPAALGFVRRAEQWALPAADNIGACLRLAYAACDWLAEWSGAEEWRTGTWAAAVDLGEQQRRTVAERDPARNAAAAILNDRVAHGEEWTNTARDRRGWDEQRISTPCGITHAEEPCNWINMLVPAFRAVVTESPETLARTRFAGALHRTTGKGLTRKTRTGQGADQVHVYTLCTRALETLDTEDEGEATPTYVEETTTQAAAPVTSPAEVEQARAVVEQQDQEPAVEVDQEPVYRVAPSGQEPGLALAEAARDAVTDLFADWRVKDFRAAAEFEGWDDHDWNGFGESVRVSRAGVDLTVRLDPEPEQHAAAFTDYTRVSGRRIRTSVAGESTALLRSLADNLNGKTPRWSLGPKVGVPSKVVEDWQSGGHWTQYLHWGETAPGLHQWDANVAHLPGFTQARLAPLAYGETYTRYQGDEVPDLMSDEVRKGRVSGMWWVTLAEWPWPDLPSPTGQASAGWTGWISTEVVRLFGERVEATGRRDFLPTVHHAYLAPAARVAPLGAMQETITAWLNLPKDRPARRIVKDLYQSLAGRLVYPGAMSIDVNRPDWGHHIRDNSWCATVRRAWRLAETDPAWAPRCVHVDALYVAPEGEPPGLPIHPSKPRSFKYEGSVPEVEQRPMNAATITAPTRRTGWEF